MRCSDTFSEVNSNDYMGCAHFSLIAPPVQSPWSRQQQPASLMTYHTGGGGGGFYGNQDNAMATFFSDSEPKKKKYAKEAWPGKKPTAHLLL